MAKDKDEKKEFEPKEESYMEKKFKGMPILKPAPKPEEVKISKVA